MFQNIHETSQFLNLLPRRQSYNKEGGPSSQVTRIAARSEFWEHAIGAMGATGAAGAAEVVSRTMARSLHPTRAGGQVEGS